MALRIDKRKLLCVVSSKGIWPGADSRWFSWGGFPAQVSALASLFDDLSVVSVQEPPRPGQEALPAHAEIRPLAKPSKWKGLRRKLGVAWRLPYYLARLAHGMRDADAVYLSPPGDIPLLGLIVGIVLRKRLIVRYCAAWENNNQASALHKLTKRIMRRFAGGRRVMIATGIGDQPPARNMEWIFASTITQAELDSIQPEFDRPAGQPLQFSYVGRLTTAKGVALLLEAAHYLLKELKAQPGSFRINLIGDGPEEPAFRRYVQDHGLDEYVRFHGLLDREALLTQMMASDVCVLPSYSESFGKVRVEAMLCGVPVLTTPVGFANRIVGTDGERGWIVPVGDAPALAAQMHQILLVSPDWPALRRRCRQYVLNFTLEAWAQAIGAICDRQWGTSLAGGKRTYEHSAPVQSGGFGSG